MRYAILAISLFLVQLSLPAKAQKIDINGVARSVSLFSAIVKHCPAIPAETAQKYALAFFDVGTKSFGKQRFGKQVASEIPRRMREVEDTGARQWCQSQLTRPLL